MEALDRLHTIFQSEANWFKSVVYHEASEEVALLSNAWQMAQFGTKPEYPRRVVTLPALPAGDDECVTFDFPDTGASWREQIVEEAIREDAQNGR
jgi:hypothetical protein